MLTLVRNRKPELRRRLRQGQRLWLAANAITGVAEGGAVATWEDLSPFGNDAVATATREPALIANALNGLPIIRADGTDEMNTATLGIASQPNTTIVVAKSGSVSRWTDGEFELFRQIVDMDGGVVRLYAGSAFVAGTTDYADQWVLATAVFNGASSVLYANGTQEGTGNPGSNGIGIFRLAHDGFGNRSVVDLAEVMVFEGTLNTFRRQGIEDYLSAKYGIPLGRHSPRPRARRLWFVSAVADTFTASAAVTVGAATASGSAEFDAPVYEGTAAVTVGAATASGSATFTAPVYTGSAAVTVAAATASGSAEFTAPVYTGEAAVTVAAATAAGSAQFATEVYLGSAAVTTGAATASGSATFEAGTFTAAAAVTVGAATASGSATFTAPVFTGEAAVTVAAAVASGSATFAGIDRTASAAVTVATVTAAGSATFVAPVYTAAAAVTVAAVTAQGSAVTNVESIVPPTVTDRVDFAYTVTDWLNFVE